uniref:Uncharacterized protein n=1 Tax=Rhizophagus irregularis (strain DAOM 181602 / DAOM 197198 / MUCL 43194) TaxID=747089 RepID=U9TZA0_RHIID
MFLVTKLSVITFKIFGETASAKSPSAKCPFVRAIEPKTKHSNAPMTSRITLTNSTIKDGK